MFAWKTIFHYQPGIQCFPCYPQELLLLHWDFRVQPLSLLLHRPEPTLEEVMFQAVGLKYANKRKDAKTSTLKLQ